MRKKRMIFVIILLILTICSGITYFFTKSDYKTIKIGNNNNKSAEEIKEYILNISSYEAKISVEITSNKNTNKYVMKQKYANPNIFKQIVMEPENIQGLETTYDGEKLKIQNTKIELSKLYENYPCISENALALTDFVEEYKKSDKSKYSEKNSEIIMETKSENKYLGLKTLYIDKNTSKPTKLVIQDINKKTLVYILYNEIKINNLNKEEALAFKLNMQLENI